MRTLRIVVLGLPLAACAPAPPPATESPIPEAAPRPVETPPATPAQTAGPGGFPLPADAVSAGDAPGGAGMIKIYKVPRGRVQVADELRTLLAAGGWTILAESGEGEPRPAIRLQVSKDGRTFKASVAGDDAQAAIILTLP